MMKRALIGAIVFGTLLLSSLFGLSFAVASLSNVTTVDEMGTLLSKADLQPIATDSRSMNHAVMAGVEQNSYCILESEVDLIKEEVLSGKNVVLELFEDETEDNLLAEQLSASGAKFDGESACFWNAEFQKHSCFRRSATGCTLKHSSHARRLGIGECLELDHPISLAKCLAEHGVSMWIFSW